MTEQCGADETLYPGLDADVVRRLLVGIEKVARLFDTTPSTINRWVKGGVMPAPRKVGGRCLWSGDELRQWIKDGCPEMKDWRR